MFVALVVATPRSAAEAKSSVKCGPKDQPETGALGQVPLADQLSGRSPKPYFCGVTLIGKNSIEDHGNNHRLDWWKTGKTTCAYFGTLDRNVNDSLSGAAVLDVSDPTDPQVKTILRDPGAVNNVQMLQAKNGILLAKGNSPDQQHEASAVYLAVYDISKGSTRPRLKSTFELQGQSLGGRVEPGREDRLRSVLQGGMGPVRPSFVQPAIDRPPSERCGQNRRAATPTRQSERERVRTRT